MSRTTRNTPTVSKGSNGNFRRLQTLRAQYLELAAWEAIVDEGFRPSNRLKVRANVCIELLPAPGTT